MVESVLNVGDMVGGRWRIDRFIAAGGFGQVFAATDASTAQIGSVAVKVLLGGASTAERNAFLTEVRHTAAFRHPNLVAHIDSGLLEYQDQSAVFLVTELCDESLGAFFTRQPGGTLSDDQLPPILADLSAGLAHLHQSGRVHRDLKPANILRAGPTWKLADFGLVRDLSSSGVYHINTLAGTPRYMAPEFFTGGEIGPETDVWSLGVVIHELMTGAGVHSGDGAGFIHNLTTTAPTIAPTLSPNIAAVVRACLEADPDSRPAATALPARLADPAAATANASPGFDRQQGEETLVDDDRTGNKVVPPAVTGAIPHRSNPTETGDQPAETGTAGSAGWAAPSRPPVTPALTELGLRGQGPESRSTGRRGLLVGVLGTVVLVAIAGAVAFLLLGGGAGDEGAGGAVDAADVGQDPATGVSQLDEQDTIGGGDTGSSVDDSETAAADDGDESGAVSDDRSFGDTLFFTEFEVGDCADPDFVDDEFRLSILRDCETPHQYEVIGILESPNAGGEFPGDRELLIYSATNCPEIFKSRWGIEQGATRLQVIAFSPKEQDWAENVFTMVCVVNNANIQPLETAIGDDIGVWKWQSGDALGLIDLQENFCFDEVNELQPSGIVQRVVYRFCDELHHAQMYRRVLLTNLPYAQTGEYPGDAEMASEVSKRCHLALHDIFGEDHNDLGFTSDSVHPIATDWEEGQVRTAPCLVVFDEPVDRPLSEIAKG